MGHPSGTNSLNPTEYIGAWRRTEGTETSQYLQEERKILIPSVAASETGTSLNRLHVKLVSVVQSGLWGRTRRIHESAGKSQIHILVEEHGKAHHRR